MPISIPIAAGTKNFLYAFVRHWAGERRGRGGENRFAVLQKQKTRVMGHEGNEAHTDVRRIRSLMRTAMGVYARVTSDEEVNHGSRKYYSTQFRL
jgi:hypothetical protein